jgi:hypothetical protein
MASSAKAFIGLFRDIDTLERAGREREEVTQQYQIEKMRRCEKSEDTKCVR